MATIITVHGTNATGPEEGDSWWQKGSEFERDIRELVESEDGQLKFEPHVWDGANSESSRRKAGERLFRKILGLEASHESYCLVGHSHGGSVISNALLKASAKKNQLESLKKWITIGTPFIFTKKHFLLFSRLNFIGKAAYVTLITYISIIFVLLYFDPLKDASEQAGYIARIALMLIFAMPFIGFYLVMFFINSRSLYTLRKKNIKYSDKNFSGRWFSLWHKNDEAIQGLRSVKSLNFNIFADDFSIPVFSFVSLFIFPAIFLYVIFSQDFMMWLDEFSWQGPFGLITLIGGGQDVGENVDFILKLFAASAANIVTAVFGVSLLGPADPDLGEFLIMMAVLLFMIPLSIFLLSLVLMFFIKH